jgi:hypothetical protein
MTKSEMRFLRREIINFALQNMVRPFPASILTFISEFVRGCEVSRYGLELQAYK